MSESTTPDQPLKEPLKQPAQANSGSPEPTHGGAVFTPRVDILEFEDELRLQADMPGVELEDLEIHFENEELRLYGRVTPREEDVQLVYREYEIGDFQRSFRIGSSIDASKIAAELTDGVLTVHLPKSESLKPRRIKVTAG